MNPRARQVTWFLTGMGLAAFVVVLVFAVFTAASKSTEIRDQQQTNTPLLISTNRTLQIVEDCTTPGQPCYDRGQERLASAIADINQVSIYAAACADQPRRQSVEQIQSCVISKLAEADTPGP
jgi:hypothetical protein